jgi:hypothetical protein
MVPDAHQKEVSAFRQGQDAEVKARAEFQVAVKSPNACALMFMRPANCPGKARHRCIHG